MGKIKLNGIDYGGGSGSGDTVEWTQIEQSGTKIAEIDINGTSQNVYAPSGGGGGGIDYTTTEQVVGTWLGKPLYQQSIPFSGLNFSGNTNYSFDVSSYAINAERIFLDLDMSFYIVNNVQRSFIPATVSPIQPPYVIFRVETNRNNASGYITIRYTKTTD